MSGIFSNSIDGQPFERSLSPSLGSELGSDVLLQLAKVDSAFLAVTRRSNWPTLVSIKGRAILKI